MTIGERPKRLLSQLPLTYAITTPDHKTRSRYRQTITNYHQPWPPTLLTTHDYRIYNKNNNHNNLNNNRLELLITTTKIHWLFYLKTNTTTKQSHKSWNPSIDHSQCPTIARTVSTYTCADTHWKMPIHKHIISYSVIMVEHLFTLYTVIYISYSTEPYNITTAYAADRVIHTNVHTS